MTFFQQDIADEICVSITKDAASRGCAFVIFLVCITCKHTQYRNRVVAVRNGVAVVVAVGVGFKIRPVLGINGNLDTISRPVTVFIGANGRFKRFNCDKKNTPSRYPTQRNLLRDC